MGFGVLLIGLSIVAGPGLASSRAVIVNAAGVILGLGLVAYCRSQKGRPGVAGQWSVALFGAFIALSGFSITWSVDPSATWDEVNRLLGYLAVFTGSVVVARTFPQRWRSVLLGLALASVGISIVALLSKITPETLAPNERYARLREPLQYWNAVGLIAAFGVPLWLYYGTRRIGRPILDILSAPALTVEFVVIMLSYSRGALIAAACAVAVWVILAPARLRTAAALVLPLVGAAVIVLWAFAQTDLTTDNIDLLQRETAGHRFGAVVLVTVVLVTLLSLLLQFLIAAKAPTGALRRRVGFVLLCGVLLVPIAGAAALTQSQRGLGGTISNGWYQLTNPAANTVAGSAPANSPNRLTSAGNARSLYWRDAFRLAKAHPVIGVGANGYGTARLRVRTDTYDVEHAHGFLVQVLADLGFVGLAVALALWGSWLVAVKRTLGKRQQPWPPERVGSMALLAAVVAFGVHSSLDWTWSFPAATLPALIAAGWLAGRGSIGAPADVPNPAEGVADGEGRAAAVGRWVPRLQLAAFMLLALWSITEPYRAFRTSQQALQAISKGDVPKAVKLSKRAVQQDDVSLDTHAIEAAALVAGGDVTAARAAIDDGVAQQPNNPAAWVQLFNFELYSSGDAARAVAAYRAATYLDPYSNSLRASLTAALATAATAPAADPAPTAPASTTAAPATTP
ncbi:MAG: O-antigen ligase family protein [Solirubrobacteraceae bacterium]